MQKINLLYVITKLELGGAQKQLLTIVSALDTKKLNVYIYTSSEGFLLEEFKSLKNITIVLSKSLIRNINLLKDFLELFKIYHFIKKHKIDIVHTHSSKAGILGRFAAGLAGVKCIIHTVHGWSFNDCQPFLARFFFIVLERLAAFFSQKLIVVSLYDKQKGLSNRIGSEKQYVLISYGINHAQFNRRYEDIREELGISKEEKLIGMISCLKPQKSPFDFIKLAFFTSQKFSNLRFLLVGDGVLRPQIERLILKLKLQNKVILTGWRTDIPRILSSFDIFVLTSLWEGLPISVLEAMASSKPVIVTETGGVQEAIFDGENGYLVKRRDLTSMVNKLTALLDNQSLRESMGRDAQESLVGKFTIEDMIRQTKGLYESAIVKENHAYAY